jgi:P27 family predicted phage terminase small subunit
MPGPRPKPTALKVVAGTFRPDRSPANEPAPRPDIGDPPDFLDDQQRSLWLELVEESPAGLLTAVDRGIVGRYVVVLDAFAAAVKLWNQSGKHRMMRTPEGRLTESPLLKALRRDLDPLRAMEAELGYTPAARTRIDIPDDGLAKGKLAKYA